jgi:DNA-binding response OmpR family regulator
MHSLPAQYEGHVGHAAAILATRDDGKGHLSKRANLAWDRSKQGQPRSILIIEDEMVDAERLTATLRVLFGYQADIHYAATLEDALGNIDEQSPSVIFLDDILKPSGDASHSIPKLREAGYEGPIIVVSGEVTHRCRRRLLTEGACDVIHKDDVDSVRVAEALVIARAADEKSRKS